MRRLIWMSLFLVACSGSKEPQDTQPVEQENRTLAVSVSPTSIQVGEQSFPLTTGDTLDRGPIEAAIAEQGADHDIKIVSEADVAFGLVAYIVDVATDTSPYVDLKIGTRDAVSMMKTPGDGFNDPYLIVTTKREKPIAAQCPDPCNPAFVMVGHQADAMVGSVWSRTSSLTANRYKWWLAADYGDMWKSQLKAKKEDLAKCVHSAKAEHGFGDVNVTVRFLITRGGSIDEVTFDFFDAKYQPLYDCVSSAVQAIEMPRMAETRVKYDYFFGGKAE